MENLTPVPLPRSQKTKQTKKQNKLTQHLTPLTQYESSMLNTSAHYSKNATTVLRENKNWFLKDIKETVQPNLKYLRRHSPAVQFDWTISSADQQKHIAKFH